MNAPCPALRLEADIAATVRLWERDGVAPEQVMMAMGLAVPWAREATWEPVKRQMRAWAARRAFHDA